MADSTAALTESMRRYVDMQNKQLNLQRQQNEMMERSSRATLTSRLQLGTFSSYMMSLTKSAGFAGIAVRGLGRATMTITSLIAEPIRLMQDLGNVISHFVGLANPGAVQLFTLALNDAMAVMGRMLTPVLRGMTIYIRAFGDVLAKMEPVLQPLFSQIGQLFANIALGAAEIWKAGAPLVELLTDVLVDLMREGARAVAFFQGIFVELIKTLMSFLGLKSKRFNPDADSTGASVRQVRTQGVEEFARSVFEKSLMGIFNQGKKDPVAIQTEILDAIKQGQAFVQKLKEKVDNIFSTIESAWNVFGPWLSNNTAIAIINGLTKSTGLKDYSVGFIDVIAAIRKAFVR